MTLMASVTIPHSRREFGCTTQYSTFFTAGLHNRFRRQELLFLFRSHTEAKYTRYTDNAQESRNRKWAFNSPHCGDVNCICRLLWGAIIKSPLNVRQKKCIEAYLQHWKQRLQEAVFIVTGIYQKHCQSVVLPLGCWQNVSRIANYLLLVKLSIWLKKITISIQVVLIYLCLLRQNLRWIDWLPRFIRRDFPRIYSIFSSRM